MVDGQHHTLAAFSSSRGLVPIVQEAGWASESVWTRACILDPLAGIRSPDSPARSELVYRLRYADTYLQITGYLKETVKISICYTRYLDTTFQHKFM